MDLGGDREVGEYDKILRELMVWEVLLSMCCFYWLMNKEAAFDQWLNRV